jgi:hypothetical protein
MGEMSAQNVAEVLGSFVQRRAETDRSSLRGARVGVTPGSGNSRFARMVIALPNGQTFTAQIEKV